MVLIAGAFPQIEDLLGKGRAIGRERRSPSMGRSSAPRTVTVHFAGSFRVSWIAGGDAFPVSKTVDIARARPGSYAETRADLRIPDWRSRATSS